MLIAEKMTSFIYPIIVYSFSIHHECRQFNRNKRTFHGPIEFLIAIHSSFHSRSISVLSTARNRASSLSKTREQDYQTHFFEDCLLIESGTLSEKRILGDSFSSSSGNRHFNVCDRYVALRKNDESLLSRKQEKV